MKVFYQTNKGAYALESGDYVTDSSTGDIFVVYTDLNLKTNKKYFGMVSLQNGVQWSGSGLQTEDKLKEDIKHYQLSVYRNGIARLELNEKLN